MKKKGITLALLLSCTTAAAAPALPSTNSDLRALEQNKAQTPQQAELTSVQTEGDKLSGEQSLLSILSILPVLTISTRQPVRSW